MTALDRRAYEVRPSARNDAMLTLMQLLLEKSNAGWILHAPTIEFVCNEEEPVLAPLEVPSPPLTPPSSPLVLPSTPMTKSQRKKASRKAQKGVREREHTLECCEDQLDPHGAAIDYLARLRRYLVQPADLSNTIRPSSWHSFISALFRYVVLRIPSLLLLALDPSSQILSVEQFLDLLEERMCFHCEGEITLLWRSMKFAKGPIVNTGRPEQGLLGVGVLADVLIDVFRDPAEDGVHVDLLGGRVYKTPTSTPTAWEEYWDLFYSFASENFLGRSELTLAGRLRGLLARVD